jgi:flagellar biosynthesis anti-sigma factor FlgM
MKVNDPNLSSPPSLGTGRSQEAEKAGPSPRHGNPQGNVQAPRDDVHLSELVRSLRSLAADSPERQARLEEIARAYAKGTYQVDEQATASKIIDDVLGDF